MMLIFEFANTVGFAVRMGVEYGKTALAVVIVR
jgi:hypothetical protein